MRKPDSLEIQDGTVESAGRITGVEVYEIAAIQKMLAEVAAAEVEVNYFPFSGEKPCDIMVSLPHNCYLDGFFTCPESGEIYVHMGNWIVNAQLRRNGIGRRLIETFNEEAKKLGAKHLHTCAVSKEGLKGVSSFFGFENLEIIGDDADRFKGKSLEELLEMMDSGTKTGYNLRMRIKK
jgi:GNAT superfamily N-acetyltransferase